MNSCIMPGQSSLLLVLRFNAKFNNFSVIYGCFMVLTSAMELKCLAEQERIQIAPISLKSDTDLFCFMLYHRATVLP